MEMKRFEYREAQDNCAKVFGPSGKLFEPKLIEINNEVYETFKVMFGESYIRLGMQDLSREGQFVYGSNMEPIKIEPWYENQPDGGTVQNCVTFGNYGEPKWIDYQCTGRLFSICQSN